MNTISFNLKFGNEHFLPNCVRVYSNAGLKLKSKLILIYRITHSIKNIYAHKRTMHEQTGNNFINTVVTKCDDSAITINSS